MTGPRTTSSCDEYPFASANEGARSGGTGRTFSFCSIKDNNLQIGASGPGYSVCLIPREENSRAGALLGWFFSKNRVMDGDAFRANP